MVTNSEKVNFILTTPDKLEGVQNEHSGSVIFVVNDVDDQTEIKDIYLDRLKITDRISYVNDRTELDGLHPVRHGMIANVRGTSDLLIYNGDEWVSVVDGYATEDDLNAIKSELEEIKGSLGELTSIVGTPGDSDEEPTGILGEIEDLKRKASSSLSRYSIPVMTPAMAEAATEDLDVDFDASDDPYLLTDFDGGSLEGETTNNIVTSINGTYLNIMMRAIRDLQMEVARMKNSFNYGIDSYQETKTAKSTILSEMEDTIAKEPLWAIDPGYMSEVSDSNTFNTYLDSHHSFSIIGDGNIDVSVDEQLTFKNCKGVFTDGDSNGENFTLYEQRDSKQIVYIVTDKPTVTLELVSIDNKAVTKTIDFEPLLKGNIVNRYGFCVVISRKVETSKKNEYKGFNYVYFSIINYDNDSKLYEGYWYNDELFESPVDIQERYSIRSLSFDRLTLYRMKFYTKYEDFSEEVISSAPSEEDYKYEVAHITIRAVKNGKVLESIKNQLKENELIWNKEKETLHIKSNGKICLIGSNGGNNNNDNDNNMTDREIIAALEKMGIVVNVNYKKDSDGNDTDEILSLNDLSLAPISDFTFVNEDTGKRFTYIADAEGNLIGKDKSVQTIAEFIESLNANKPKLDTNGYKAVRGFISDYLFRKSGTLDTKNGVNYSKDAGSNSDRLRISSLYAPIVTDKTHGCTHSFIELENTSNIDIPLEGIYLHFYNPMEDKVYHLALDGVCPAGGTYLVRGAKHAEFDDESAFIKVSTYDKEWYDNKELVSFEQEKVITIKSKNEDGKDVENIAPESPVKVAYRFCLTYGLADLKKDDILVGPNDGSTIDDSSYDSGDFPNFIKNARFIDSCSYSTFADVSKQIAPNNTWYINGKDGGGITITENTMFRNTFALDPAKQAFNGFNVKDGSRVRYNKGQDMQIVKLDKEFIGYPFSDEIVPISRYTPKASFEHRNVMTDKTQLDKEKPNMVTCSFGVDVYDTRCFNWISCGTFDENVWVRKKNASLDGNYVDTILEIKNEYDIAVKNVNDVFEDEIHGYSADGSIQTGALLDYIEAIHNGMSADEYGEYVAKYDIAKNKRDNAINEAKTIYESKLSKLKNVNGWNKFQSYTTVSSQVSQSTASIHRKEFSPKVNNAVYARIINRFPGNDVLFTSHKCIVEFPDAIDNPVVYEYVVGRADKDGNPDMNHCSDIQTFTIYPRTWEGRVYQITDQQGFHWIEYQVWAAAAKFLNKKIDDEVAEINAGAGTKVFPILINTGDMTQSGARINEWLDYYNGGKCLFNHLEQMNCVGNNDLSPINPHDLGTGNDNNKSNSLFFHYFYCFDVKDNDVLAEVDDNQKKFFNGESLVVEKNDVATEDRYIPSTYYFRTKDVIYIVLNSEIPKDGVTGWFGLDSNIYTGIKMVNNGTYDVTTKPFTPIYETLYAWLKENKIENGDNDFIGDKRRVVVAMHEMPFTVITRESLKKGEASYLASTRNHPTAADARVGSNVNQLSRVENRGTYWMSRLLEYFGCKLVIGGHKHTYALSYPVKEKYNWKHNGDASFIDSWDDMKPMGPTLADEAGANPEYIISWDIDYNTAKSEYNVKDGLNEGTVLNSTKTPYIPEDMYIAYGENTFKAGMADNFRCCTPKDDDGTKTFVTYSMCQATGYKLKSNKELPSPCQLFSMIIPKTDVSKKSDSPSGEQLYPMYSVLEFNNDCSELDVKMVRIGGIFDSEGTDSFTQSKYGKNKALVISHYLRTWEEADCKYSSTDANKADKLDDANEGDFLFTTDKRQIWKKKDGSWVAFTDRMYGRWIPETDQDNISRTDNRYLHITF